MLFIVVCSRSSLLEWHHLDDPTTIISYAFSCNLVHGPILGEHLHNLSILTALCSTLANGSKGMLALCKIKLKTFKFSKLIIFPEIK